jgi:gamma-glutamylcyclotransferase (GGCT)/AIG2-like uncharacterized protein YtfP
MRWLRSRTDGLIDMTEFEWVFAYGSNMNLDDLSAWLSRHGYATDGITTFVRATLRDHHLVWNYYSNARGGGAANVEASPGHVLPGIALRVDAATRAAIDEKERHPNYYSRGTRTYELLTEGGSTIDAWVYSVRPERCRATAEWPTRMYRSLLVEAAIVHALPEEHISYLEQLPVRD